MRIAIPIVQEKLSLHFGHCESFALMDVENGEVVAEKYLPSPVHQPGLLPRWLAEEGANVIIAGGMGVRAQNLFTENGIKVVVGAPREKPNKLVVDYINDMLVTGDNACDH